MEGRGLFVVKQRAMLYAQIFAINMGFTARVRWRQAASGFSSSASSFSLLLVTILGKSLGSSTASHAAFLLSDVTLIYFC